MRDSFEGLHRVDEMFSHWYEKRNRPTPDRAVDWGDEALKRLLEKGISRRDHPLVAMPELGFLVGLWNGNARRRAADIMIQCGACSSHVPNCVLLRLLPSDDGPPPPQMLEDALAVLVDAWRPDIGEIYQLVKSGDDFQEQSCGGYLTKGSPPREAGRIVPVGGGVLWFDESAYQALR
jgi:hypothetical protein